MIACVDMTPSADQGYFRRDGVNGQSSHSDQQVPGQCQDPISHHGTRDGPRG